MWVPKMLSESFRREFHQIDEFNFDSAFVNLTIPAVMYNFGLFHRHNRSMKTQQRSEHHGSHHF